MPTLVDNIFYSNITMYRFFKNAKKWRGGTYIESPTEYAKNTNAESFSGSGALTTDEVEIATKARVVPRQYNAAVVITGLEIEECKGDAEVIDTVKAKTKNAERSLKDLMGDHFWANQAGTNLDGVQDIFDATAATAYAGIDPADFAGWKCCGGNGKDNVSGNLTTTNLAENWNYCKVGTDHPTLIVTEDDIWAGIEATFFDEHKRYEDKKLANLGFDNITYHGAPIVADDKCTANTVNFFNEKYIHVYVMPGMNFKWIDFQYPTNQDIRIGHVRWYGNILCTNVYKQGQMYNVTGVA